MRSKYFENSFVKSLLMTTALLAMTPCCTKGSSVERLNNKEEDSQNHRKVPWQIEEAQKNTKELIDELNLSKPFILIVNGKELTLDQNEVDLKLGAKALFELKEGPADATKFFFCSTSQFTCPLYDAVDSGYANFGFTPNMGKPLEYRIGFCSPLELSCDEMVYRSITIKPQK